ncbi:MAG: hypothetical protein ACRCWS_01145 [Propionibacteriaceae bacterium]
MKRLSGKVVIPTLVVGTALTMTPFAVDRIRGSEHTYCTDKNGVVVDADNCDNTRHHGGGYYLNRGYYRSGYQVGQRLPSGSTRVDANDASARSAAGFDSSGKVATGKTGGFGKSGSGHSGGS